MAALFLENTFQSNYKQTLTNTYLKIIFLVSQLPILVAIAIESLQSLRNNEETPKTIFGKIVGDTQTDEILFLIREKRVITQLESVRFLLRESLQKY